MTLTSDTRTTDIAALREQLNVTEPAAPPPAPEPEHQALGVE
jgi:hypothetical protein